MQSLSREMKFNQAVREAILEEMSRDSNVIVLGEDAWRVLEEDPMHPKAPRDTAGGRVFNTPISEGGFIGCATGAAMLGLRPIVYLLWSWFMLSGFDQLVNNAAKLPYASGGQVKLPIVYFVQNAGGIRMADQHSWNLHSMLMNVPGLKIVLPSTPHDAKGLLKTSIRDNNPVVFFSHFLLGGTSGPVPEEEYTIEFGKGDVKREGKDVTIVAISVAVQKALRAARRLERQGIEAEVIDPRTLVPLDKQTILRSLQKTGHLIVVDESHQTCSAASEIAAIVAEEGYSYLKGPVARVTLPDVPFPFSSVLEDEIIPGERDIVDAVKEVLKR
jgi:pyruvate dehydrogenase E1 component beta subunit